MRLSLEEVVRKYRNSLYAAALSASQIPTDAEDAVQEALIKYYTDNREFEDESQMRYWLIRITVNKAHDLRRRFRSKGDVSWEDYIQSVDFETPEQRSLVSEVLQLPDKYRTAIHLYYYEGYTTAEIAKILNITDSSVRARRARGRRMLRHVLNEEETGHDKSGIIQSCF